MEGKKMRDEVDSQKDELPKADAELDIKYLIFFSVLELLHLSLSKGREMREGCDTSESCQNEYSLV